ncbi:hypothetical protein RJ639_032364 [Escallonia herrerae]|uniref:Transposase-associated domain-containing protein n=1 Tax=Escallonia herrerae TaxID=1293975 RepID=A0AA89BER2_9ASTE|nr:hypothetical protein RJ639_032364 [Escallonia herrerae]
MDQQDTQDDQTSTKQEEFFSPVKLKVNMDKSWINIRNRLDPLYEKGANDFVKFASKDRPNAIEILCPCTKCRNIRFVKKVQMLYEEGDDALSEEAISLAMGPLKKAERYTRYAINGFKYHTKAHESNRATQHSGVMVKANTDSYASARDMNPIAGDVNYYGVLTDINVLHYSKKFRLCESMLRERSIYEGIPGDDMPNELPRYADEARTATCAVQGKRYMTKRVVEAAARNVRAMRIEGRGATLKTWA